MPITSEQAATQLDKRLEEINKAKKIDKTLFLMWYQSFTDLEDSAQVMDYLITHKDIDIDVIENTKAVFHEVIYYFMKAVQTARGHKPLNLQEYDAGRMCADLAKDLATWAAEQEKIAKLPSIAERRDPELYKKRIAEELEGELKDNQR